MKKKILIIGASGTTGAYVTEYLTLTGKYELFVTGNNNINQAYFDSRGVKAFKLDISDISQFKNIQVDDIDVIVHLAGIMPARMEGYNPQSYIETNVKGGLNILEFARERKINKVIYGQSHSDMWGYWNTDEYIKDDAPRKLNLCGDHAVYIISKTAVVDLMEHYYLDHGILNVVLRMPNIYSYWPIHTYYLDGIERDVPYLLLIQKALKSEKIEIWGDPKKAKDMVYVKDFAQMIDKSITVENSRGIYNVCTGVPTSLEDQVKGIVDVFSPEKNKSNIVYRPDLQSQTSYYYDVTKAKIELGYEPKYYYTEMLRDMKEVMNSEFISFFK